MAYNHLSQAECDQYDIYLTNDELEDNLDDNQQSTASSWETTLQSSLDLSSLLYMKAVSALVGLKKLSFDNLPLTLSEFESIEVKISMPESIAHCNQFYNVADLNKFNNKALSLALQDFCSSEPEETLQFLNEKLGAPTTEFIVQRFLTMAFDIDIFRKNEKGSFSLKDFRLLTRYVDLVLLNRHVIHNFLCTHTGIKDDSVTRLISFQGRENITQRTEQSILDESETLCQLGDRPKPYTNNVDLSLFYGLSPADVYSTEDGPKNVIETETLNWLNMLELVQRTTPDDPKSPLTPTSESEIQKVISSNKKLISLALKARQIINFLKERLDKRNKGKKSSLFHDQFLSLALDSSNSRCAFVINPKLFLEDDGTSVTIKFSQQTSYVLGAKDEQEITVGPINYQMLEITSPKLTHHIKSPNQMVYSAIRPLPKLLYVATNLVTSLSRDMWLKNTKYASFHLIHCHVMNDDTIHNKFICKDNNDETYYKIPNLKNLLDRITIHILDQNFRRVVFPRNTYVKLALTIKPAPLDH